ncbi:aspartate carbamoyltransferase catalytic subunit [Christensenellaceae bacterium NSJ-44]|uniref:Aspartate carbamoyltransferase n=1 Tax=Luoshenia tenuis TaxID=2763654 RepID=A0A926HLS5_9FIRM|nr:aspartate carbamoyltransferase catalytic subunit [Luoshenia tenuis]MBC8528769.1 aspartate carbamoyltransferase catalytic subunit [Luoshenia tenuis]
MALECKDLLGMQYLNPEQINEIMHTAEQMKQILLQSSKKTPHLQGKSIVTLFYENSTRTRMSFELASKYMSAAAANISASTSSVQKGETLIDTGRTLDRMGTDLIIIRHPMSGAPHLLAKHVKAGVINAGDGMNEHPTQALLDLYTMREKKGADIKGLRVAIVGDVAHSRVARSNIWSLTKLGAQVRICAPRTLMPVELEKTGVQVTSSVEEAVTGADVVMGLRIQLERQKKGLFPSVKEYNDFYGLTPKRIKLADPEVLIMHPGPMNRGVEISSQVADSAASAIDEQVTNGVAVRMALLYMLTRKGSVK